MGKCSYPVDIWAIGCTYYELLSGKILFNPIKDSVRTRDYYHLCLINDTCGDFDIDFLKTTKYYKNFFINEKIIDYLTSSDRLNNKLMELNEKFNFDYIKLFLKKLLIINPKKRINIKELYNNY